MGHRRPGTDDRPRGSSRWTQSGRGRSRDLGIGWLINLLSRLEVGRTVNAYQDVPGFGYDAMVHGKSVADGLREIVDKGIY